MLIKNGKYTFPMKDDLNSFVYYKSKISGKIESLEEKNPSPKEEIKLRSRSAKNKQKANENFSLHDILFCLSLCVKGCKFENYKNRRFPSPIEGLNCDIIDDHLFASQRLTNRIIKKFNLIKKLKELNVGLIVNTEVKGEHPLCADSCDDGLDICGFSYSVSLLEKNGIDVLLCGWNDLGLPGSFYHVLKIVKKMYYYINTLNKKIIVHCHAGFGRTAIVLACYKIFTKKISANSARKSIRKGGRVHCLGSNIQFNYCKEFCKFLEISRENFFEKNKKTVAIFKINEKMLNVGEFKFKYFKEDKYIEHVPIFLLYIFDRIIEIKNNNKKDSSNIFNMLLNYNNISKEDEILVKKIKNEINLYNWEVIQKIDDLKILGHLLFNWMNHSINYVLNEKDIEGIDINNYNESYNNCKEPTKTITQCISQFIYLIREKNNIENNEQLFLEHFFNSLFGYCSEEKKNE